MEKSRSTRSDGWTNPDYLSMIAEFFSVISEYYEAEHIAVIGVCIFAALFYSAFLKKSDSTKTQITYLIAAAFGLLLVRNEFASIWGEARFSYSATYLVFSLANVPTMVLYMAFLRKQKPPKERVLRPGLKRRKKDRKKKTERKADQKRIRKGKVKHRKTTLPTGKGRREEKVETDIREEDKDKEKDNLIQKAQDILDV